MEDVKTLPLPELLERPRLAGGMIRHALPHADYVENVAVNNLVAAGCKLAADLEGNRFFCQWALSYEYYGHLMDGLRARSIMPEYLPVDRNGGTVIERFSVQPWDGDTVLLYTPHNDLVWELAVGAEHEVIRRQQAFALVGKNMGFDLILPYNPYMLRDGRIYETYAAPELLLQWAEEGYERAKSVIAQYTALPTAEKVQHLLGWEHNGFYRSRAALLAGGMATPEELEGLPEPVKPLTLAEVAS